MNREDMANKQLDLALKYAALVQAITDPENQPSQHGTVTLEYLNKAIAAEREACAKVCDEKAAGHEEDARFENDLGYKERFLVYAKHERKCAAAIRARSQSIRKSNHV